MTLKMTALMIPEFMENGGVFFLCGRVCDFTSKQLARFQVILHMLPLALQTDDIRGQGGFDSSGTT